jgi:hypothetical protein
MKEVNAFITEDGKLFATRMAAEQYEKEYSLVIGICNLADELTSEFPYLTKDDVAHKIAYFIANSDDIILEGHHVGKLANEFNFRRKKVGLDN